MIGFELENRTGDELARFVKALGQHRYVASHLILIHAFAIDAAAVPELDEANSWAKRVVGAGGAIDLASKDERLWRKSSAAELAAVLRAFWGDDRAAAQARLRNHLSAAKIAWSEDALPFDESAEDEIFPVLIDAGWELLPLAHLNWDRHKGALQSLSDYEVAKFEEENTIPPVPSLHELPQMGPVELLNALTPEGTTRAPFVLWQQGHEEYLDYVLRGVLKISRLELPETAE